jgi:hypothetical protein
VTPDWKPGSASCGGAEDGEGTSAEEIVDASRSSVSAVRMEVEGGDGSARLRS